ncbi:MAG TPA: phenylalanine--tRNA ligase subunit alpha [Elusimicrobiota bacterium]|nr:phenylalanine--tRNA ligase subunit alpha [Elusimicrobiota bacterium]
MSSLLNQLHSLRAQAQQDIAQADSLEGLETLRVRYLGRKDGQLTKILQALPSLSPEEKKVLGREANEAKISLETALNEKKGAIEEKTLNAVLSAAAGQDLTLPESPLSVGRRHPLAQVMDDIVGCFLRLGFNLAEGPEVETDFNNFTALNHPPDHPARDSHDTFYVKNFRDGEGLPLLLRTHTSPVQIRHMQTHKPPLSIVAPGRVFRHEAVDATHSFVFHQVEGLAVDVDISVADLKGVLGLFARHVFGSNVEIRFRPAYFPFVEPGIEVDISCTLCEGKGCRVCKQTGWVEMLGAGMVNPNVFRAVGYDPDKVTGYAFGIGVERVAMFKYGVDDMRLFFENDVRFLRQVSR